MLHNIHVSFERVENGWVIQARDPHNNNRVKTYAAEGKDGLFPVLRTVTDALIKAIEDGAEERA